MLLQAVQLQHSVVFLQHPQHFSLSFISNRPEFKGSLQGTIVNILGPLSLLFAGKTAVLTSSNWGRNSEEILS